MKIPFKFTTANHEEIIIDYAKISDASSIISFLNEIGGESNHLTFGKGEFYISEKEEEQLIATCLNEKKKLMLTAKHQDKIVGQLFMDRSNKARIQHIGNFGISVTKEYWGKKIAGNMISLLVKWAKNNQIERLELQVTTNNDRAISLYKKFGFQIEGAIRRAHKINNKFDDAYFMSLLM